MKTEKLLFQIGYKILAVAPTSIGVDRIAEKLALSDPLSEAGKHYAFTTFGGSPKIGDLRKIDCSKKLADLVRLHGGCVAHTVIDGIAYADEEIN